jgi:cellulose synthase/poly-beta-1,6-N-acetylglucosamine synthase-like glycosyltransferase
MSIVQILYSIVLAGLLLAVIYYYVLLGASVTKLRRAEEQEVREEDVKFALIIPAHNEEPVIERTVSNLLKMKYQRSLFDIVVIADNCEDQTASVARESGAICVERNNEPAGRKGFAISWYLENVLPDDQSYEALIIIDADSQPLPDFLRLMSNRLRAGGAVLQGKHVISNPEDSIFTRMADIDMRINNRLRNQARTNMGLSCRLMGDAMCFERTVLEKYPWGAHSLVEDREYGIQLIGRGIRIEYVREAMSLGQAASGWSRAKSQRMRWTGGVQSLRRRFVKNLIVSGIRDRNLSAIDQAIELILPPFSILTAVAVVLLLLQALFAGNRGSYSLELSAGVTIALLLVPVFGLLLDRAPVSLYPFVFLGPIYTLWRNWIGLVTLLRSENLQWIRTKRTEES